MGALQLKFLDQNDVFSFVRADALSAVCVEHEQALNVTVPLNPDRLIRAGMKVVFRDTTPSGGPQLRFFEVRDTVDSMVSGTQDVVAEDMGLSELQDIIVASVNYKGANWLTVMNAILTGTGWAVGTIPPDLPDDTYTYQVYKVQTGSSLKLTLRSGPGTKYSVLGYYANGTQVRRVSLSGDWMKVIVGSKTGYMSAASLLYYKTITVAGLPTITLKGKFQTVYNLMISVLTVVGLVPSFRVEYSGGVLTRHIDFMYKATEITNGTRIEIDRNAYSDRIEYDDHGMYTAVYPIGANDITISSAVWSMDGGNPADKPYGQTYLEDVTATALYGRNGRRRECRIEFPNCETADELIVTAWAWLQENNHPKVSVNLSAYDLAQMGYGGIRLSYAERVNVVLKPLTMQLPLNVVQLTRDLIQKERTLVTIGAFEKDVISETVRNSEAISQLQASMSSLLDMVYPIGSVYMSYENVSPAEFIGGTWVRIQNRFLVGAGDSYARGNTGGATNHKHLGTSGYSSNSQGVIATNGEATGTVDKYRVSSIDNSGNSQSNITVPYTGDGSSLPPYYAVYMWQRTA